MARRPLSAVQCAALAVLGALAVAEYYRWHQERERMMQLATESGVLEHTPQVAADISSEPDIEGMRLRAARALLGHELDRSWLAALTPAERTAAEARGLSNLESSREIAALAYARRPSSWQAAMVLGGATYLTLARQHDPALATDRAAWHEPLQRAQRLGPGQREPLRLLTAAYLSQWTRLSQIEREEIIPLLESAFADPPTADLLLETWIQIAPSLALAYKPVPDTPEAWWQLQLIYAGKRDWERYCDARNRWIQALERHLDALVGQAKRLAGSGDAVGARARLGEVLARMPVDGRHAGLLTRVIATLPPGPVTLQQARILRRWLTWSRERCLLDRCPLPAETVRRIGWLAELPGTHQAAETALMSLDLPQAELYERRWAIPRSQAWSAFYLLKARILADRGEYLAARASLDSISAEVRDSTAAWATERYVNASSPVRAPTTQSVVRRWSSWIREDRLARVELATLEGAGGLELVFESVPSDGSAIGVHWDGHLVGFFPAWEGQSIPIGVPVKPGAHTLVIETLTGPLVNPGLVRLLEKGV